MYRLLIVDDEEIIVDGLAEIFSQLEHLELDVYRAYSGAEALERLNSTRIDIVLTDIRMPGMDGLQLMERILAMWPHCRIIFLTGYDEFDYVYQAIRHPDVRYLLKTEEPEAVIAAVEEAAQEIEKDVRIDNLLQQAQERMNRAHGLFQREYLLHLLAGDGTAGADAGQFEQFGIPLDPEASVFLLTGIVRNQPEGRTYRERLQDMYSLRLIVDRHMGSHLRIVHVQDEANHFVLLVQPHAQGTAAIGPWLRGAVELVQNASRASMNLSVSFAMCGEACAWSTLPERFDRLCSLLRYRVGPGTEMIIFDDGIPPSLLAELPEARNALQESRRQVDILAVNLDSGRQEAYLSLFDACTEPLRRVHSRNCNAAIELYYAIALMLLGHINKWKLSELLAFRIGLGGLMRVDDHESAAEAVAYLRQVSEHIFALQQDEQGRRADFAVEVIHAYIAAHLGEDLSLVRLAELVYLNPSYLSRLYKQVTGRNLSETIDHARIQKAKDLMEKEGVRIYEVGRKVGYETAASFTRFFRKWAGVSPQEYLESVQKGKARSAL